MAAHPCHMGWGGCLAHISTDKRQGTVKKRYPSRVKYLERQVSCNCVARSRGSPNWLTMNLQLHWPLNRYPSTRRSDERAVVPCTYVGNEYEGQRVKSETGFRRVTGSAMGPKFLDAVAGFFAAGKQRYPDTALIGQSEHLYRMTLGLPARSLIKRVLREQQWIRPNSEHQVSNFQSSLTIWSKRIAKSKSDLKGGGPERSRTSDLRFRKPLLYPAELRDRYLVSMG